MIQFDLRERQIIWRFEVRKTVLSLMEYNLYIRDTNWATWWQNLFLPYANNKGADQHIHLLAISEISRTLLLSQLSRPVSVLTGRNSRRPVLSWRGSIRTNSVRMYLGCVTRQSFVSSFNQNSGETSRRSCVLFIDCFWNLFDTRRISGWLAKPEDTKSYSSIWKGKDEEPIKSSSTSCRRHQTGKEHKQFRRH